MLWASISCWEKLRSKMFDKYNNYEPHCNKSEKRLHTGRAALNWLLDENDASLTLTTLASAAAAIGKKVNLQLANAWSSLGIPQINFILLTSSSTSQRIEQRGFQSSVSRHGVELFKNHFEPRLCCRSFRVKIRGLKPEKLDFHPYSSNMKLLVIHTIS